MFLNIWDFNNQVSWFVVKAKVATIYKCRPPTAIVLFAEVTGDKENTYMHSPVNFVQQKFGNVICIIAS